jgi:hypothetical protein
MKLIMENWRKYIGEGLVVEPREPDWSRCVELKANPEAGYKSEIKCIPKDGVLDMRYFDTSSINPNDPQYSGYPGAEQDQDKISKLYNIFNEKVLRGLIIPCSSDEECAQKEQIVQEELHNVLQEERNCAPGFGARGISSKIGYCGPDARAHKMFSKPWFFAVTGWLLSGMGPDLQNIGRELRSLAHDMKSHEFNRLSGGSIDRGGAPKPAVYGGELTQLDDEGW